MQTTSGLHGRHSFQIQSCERQISSAPEAQVKLMNTGLDVKIIQSSLRILTSEAVQGVVERPAYGREYRHIPQCV